MKKKKEVRRIVVLSALAALGFGGVAVSSTYALFTSESKTNVTVASGKVDVESTITDLVTYSGTDLTGNSSTDQLDKTSASGTFTNGGTAKINDDGDLELADVTPGDKVTFKIKVKNNSTVAIKYRTLIKEASDGGLFSGLTFKIGGFTTTGRTKWAKLEAGSKSEVDELECEVSLPSDAGNQYQDKSATISFTVEAVQGNAQTYTYPKGVTKDTIKAATNFVHTDTQEIVDGKWTYVPLEENIAKMAFTKNGDETIYYANDICAALNAGATKIYVSEDAVFTYSPSHYALVKNDLVVYANDADFLGIDLYPQSGYNVNLTINDAINLRVWGTSPDDTYTHNITFNNCIYTLKGDKAFHGESFLYISGSTGTLNVAINDCYIANFAAGVYMNCNGSITIKNTTFRRCATGIKASHKTASGTLDINITDTTFYSCGADKTTYPGLDNYYYVDSSAIKCKTKSLDGIQLNLTNVAVNNTIGEYSFHIDDDDHTTSYTGNTTVVASNVTVDGKAYTFSN